jgi:prevent-host-death family protein
MPGSFVVTMATKIGIRELRDTLTSTIRRVQRGEKIEVTHHGTPVAVLAPLPADRIERLLAAGDIAPAKPLEGALRRYPVTGERSASQAIEDDRAER